MKERKPTARELHEQQRKELWMKMVVAFTQSGNSTSKYAMERWADYAVDEFDKRFSVDANK